MAYQTSQGLASLGRNGDSMLVHMNPTEVAGLQGLAMSQGGSLTINPHTGLPEAFSLGGFFRSLLPVFAGAATGGAGAPLWAGIAAGAATGAVTNRKDPLMGALTGGLGGYGGFGIGKSLFSAGAPSLSAGAAGGGSSGLATGGGYVPGATSAADIAYNSAMMGPTAGTVNTGLSNVGTSMMTDPSILNARNAAQSITSAGGGAGSPIANSAASAAEKALSQYGSNLSQAKTGLGNIFSGDQAAIDAYTKGIGAESAMGALGKTAMPLGGALLGGLEPSDIYGEPINMDEAKKKQAYDPYATLNLSGDTGLRLYAAGGTVGNPSVGGGLSDLYNRPEGATAQNISADSYGIGRLNNLAGEQSRYQAQTLGYAMGGPVSFADGGDTNPITSEIAPVEDSMGIAALTSQPSTNQNMPVQQIQNAAMSLSGAPDASTTGGSIIEQVANNLKADPNYQPKNPIEASIVKQLKGTDPMQQGQPSLQGLGSLGPSEPMAPSFNPSQSMAPSFNPSVAMGPTYFAGINAPQGYADGGDVVAGEKGMNLDELSSLNVNTGIQSGGLSDPFEGRTGLIYDMARLKDKREPGSLLHGYSTIISNLLQKKPAAEGVQIPSYADGGDVGMNLDELPSINLNFVTKPSESSSGNSFGTQNILGSMGRMGSIGMETQRPTGIGIQGGINPRPWYEQHQNMSRFMSNTPGINAAQPKSYALNVNSGQQEAQYAQGGYLDGAGDGMSDSIPATIEGKQPARLADGEFVIPADVVSHIGNGSSKAGSKRLYAMLDKVRHARTGNKKQGKEIKAEKYLPA
jgi:hypothetical protein